MSFWWVCLCEKDEFIGKIYLLKELRERRFWNAENIWENFPLALWRRVQEGIHRRLRIDNTESETVQVFNAGRTEQHSTAKILMQREMQKHKMFLWSSCCCLQLFFFHKLTLLWVSHPLIVPTLYVFWNSLHQKSSECESNIFISVSAAGLNKSVTLDKLDLSTTKQL